MASASTIKGFAEVQANLNVEIGKIKGVTRRGLILAASTILKDTELTPPLTPVDLGNLRASRFVATANSIPVGQGTNQFKGPDAGKFLADHSSTIAEAQSIVAALGAANKKIAVMFGYTVNYALYVHENIGMHDPNNPYWKRRIAAGKKGWREGSGPKWFEASVQRNSGKVIQIIKDNIKIL